MTHTGTGSESEDAGAAYTGPVAGLDFEYINITSDNLNITPSVPNSFIHTGSGFDAIDVSGVGGINVLDGGTNSNFLVGGTGPGSQDTFFVDNRDAPANIWSTVVNFHAGDAATVWGVTPGGFDLNWVNDEGAAGFTGLTLHVTAPGRPTASLTLAGFSTADLTNGRLSTTFGAVDGNSYMYVHGDR